jgi:hypothetical protein
VVGVVVTLLVVAGVLVALLPTLLSTDAGTRWLVGQVQQRTDYAVALDELELGWTGLRAQGLVVRESPGDAPLVRVQRVEAPELSLLALSRGRLSLGEVHVYGLQMDRSAAAQPGEAGDAEPEPGDEADEADEGGEAEGPRWPEGLRAAVVLHDTVVVAGQARAELPLARVDLQDPQRIELHGGGAVTYQEADGAVRADVVVTGLFDAERRLNVAGAEWDVAAELDGLPVEAVARLAGLPSLQPLLGEAEAVSAQVIATGTLEQIDAAVRASSEHLAVGLQFAGDGERIVLSPDSSLSLRLTPDGVRSLAGGDDALARAAMEQATHVMDQVEGAAEPRLPGPEAERGGLDEIALEEPAVLSLAVEQLEVPLTAEGLPDLAGVRADLAVVSEPLRILQLRPEPRRVVLEDGRLAFSGLPVGDQVSATLDGSLTMSGRTEPVHGQLVVTRPLDRPMGSLTLQHVPTALAAAASRQDAAIVATLGPMIQQAVLSLSPGSEESLAIGGSVLTDQFDGHVVGTLSVADGVRLRIDTPTDQPTQLTLDDAALRALQLSLQPDAPVRLGLIEPALLELTLRGVRVELSEPGTTGPRWRPGQSGGEASVRLLSGVLRDLQTGERLPIRSGQLTVRADDLTGRLAFDGELSLEGATPATQPADEAARRVVIRGQADHVLNAAGEPTPELLSLSADVSARDLPTALLPAAAAPAATWLGDRVTLEGSARREAGGEATVRLAMESPRARLAQPLELTIPAEGPWRTQTPLELEAQVNQPVLLTIAQVVPVALGAVSSDSPVSVQVPEGTTFDPQQGMSGLTAEFEIDLGTLWYDLRPGSGGAATGGQQGVLAGGLVTELVPRVLGLVGVQTPDQFAARFPPIRVSLADGRAQLAPFEMAIGDWSLEFGGSVDLQTQELAMRAALPAGSLSELLDGVEDIQQYLPADAALSIGIGGTVTEPQLDMSSLRRDVTRLVARTAAQRALQEAGVDQRLGEPATRLIDQLLGGGEQRPDEPQGIIGRPASDPAAPDAEGDREDQAQPQPQRNPAANLLFEALMGEVERRADDRLRELEREQPQQEPPADRAPAPGSKSPQR